MHTHRTICCHEIILQTASLHPNSDAIAGISQPIMSFETLAKQILVTGESLADFGVQSADRLALLTPNGPIAASAFLALSSFVAVAPLNPNLTQDELRSQLQSLEANILVLAQGMPGWVNTIAAEIGIGIIGINPTNVAGQFALSGQQVSHPHKLGLAKLMDKALLLHTSGTTGKPKLIGLTHKNLTTSVQNIIETLDLTAKDRAINIMPLFHIHGLIAGLLSPIVSGGAVLCTTGLEADKFVGWATDFKASWYTGISTMHQAILAEIKANPQSLTNCNFRFIRASSAALPIPVRAGLETAFNTSVVEAYGMTEASHQMASQTPTGDRIAGSVGSATGIQIAILDTNGQRIENGLKGEVAIRGDSVITGYVNNPTANAEAFVDGWMRTGDIGTLDADGTLFLVGRIKEIIKRGGFQISPHEIEDALLAQSGISQAAAFGISHDTLGQDLMAAIVVEKGYDIPEDTIRKNLASTLSDYKIPRRILTVDEIPKGSTGKLQRIHLGQLLATQLETRFLAPANILETILCELCEEVIPNSVFGASDNFFMKGGDSLSAMALITKIEKTFGDTIETADLYKAPSITQMAQKLSEVGGKGILEMIEMSVTELSQTEIAE